VDIFTLRWIVLWPLQSKPPNALPLRGDTQIRPAPARGTVEAVWALDTPMRTKLNNALSPTADTTVRRKDRFGP